MPDIFLYLDSEQKGPYLTGQVRSMLAEGKISAETLAWQPGMSEWSTVAAVLAVLPASGGPPPVPPPSAPKPRAKSDDKMSGCVIAAVICGVIGILVIPCLAGIALGPITNGIKMAKQNAAMQQARSIEIVMSAYAADHDGAYPDGKTSTEVFQKLIDEKYVSEPGLFYTFMPGKVRATSNRLTAENVCFDATGGATSKSPDQLPLVFTTGYTLTYAPGGNATPSGDTPPAFAGMAVAYKDNMARFDKVSPDGSVLGVVAATFDPGQETYRQLRP